MTDYPEPSRSVPAVCFDFDGTLTTDTWPRPEIGAPIPEGIAALRHFYDEGFSVFIHTARPESHKSEIVFWLAQQGVKRCVYDVICGKPIADLYVDDRSWHPPWAKPHVGTTAHAEAPEEELVTTMIEVMEMDDNRTKVASFNDEAHLPPIIGLAGHMGAGKDTVGDVLVRRWGYERLGFADALKALALCVDPIVDAEGVYHNRLDDLVTFMGWEDAKRLPEVRRLLQELGAGVRHLLGDDTWIKVVLDQMQADHRYAVTDVRYPNEAKTIESEGGETWVVRRPGYDGDGHVSEALPETWFFDDEIDNDGTIEDLDAKVKRALLNLPESEEAEFTKMSARVL
jgi:hypothetical protein